MASQTPQLLAEIRDEIRQAGESRHRDAEKLLKQLKELHEVFLDSTRKRKRAAAPTRIRRTH
jgi:hypothetical protein